LQRFFQIFCDGTSTLSCEPYSNEVSVLISQATQERLKNVVEKFAVIAKNHIGIIKVAPRYEITKDVRGQIKFLEDLEIKLNRNVMKNKNVKY